jgi:hypothetical protein
MIELWRRLVIGSGIAVYLVGFGVLAGMLIERIRFDHARAGVLLRHDEAMRQWHEVLIAAERDAPAPTEVER